MIRLSTILLLLAGACTAEPNRAEPFTLYRNSPVESSLRVQWAIFQARESDPDYNRNNCEMAARLLNANIAEFRRRQGEESPLKVGFWCEPGHFRVQGRAPVYFEAEFPTDVPQGQRVPAL
jgi:hypothetical protein